MKSSLGIAVRAPLIGRINREEITSLAALAAEGVDVGTAEAEAYHPPIVRFRVQATRDQREGTRTTSLQSRSKATCSGP